MSRTYHHRHQRKAKARYEVWSKRCRKVSMWAFTALMKRLTHRFERREAKMTIWHAKARLLAEENADLREQIALPALPPATRKDSLQVAASEVTVVDVLKEFGSLCQCGDLCDCAVDGAEAMADEIVRLRAALAAAPKVTVTNKWTCVDKDGAIYNVLNKSQADAEWDAGIRDKEEPDFAPHTVRRVALLDDPTTRGESDE